jgi:hypothetical protein
MGWGNLIPRGARTSLATQTVPGLQGAVADAGLTDLDLAAPITCDTFTAWLEDAAIPWPVIDELMGHSGGRRDRGTGSPTPDPGDICLLARAACPRQPSGGI